MSLVLLYQARRIPHLHACSPLNLLHNTSTTLAREATITRYKKKGDSFELGLESVTFFLHVRACNGKYNARNIRDSGGVYVGKSA
jgi:hypothetical protein